MHLTLRDILLILAGLAILAWASFAATERPDVTLSCGSETGASCAALTDARLAACFLASPGEARAICAVATRDRREMRPAKQMSRG
jgi:hypothetical protein